MKKITARILALLLVALMACAMLPTFAMAAEEPTDPTQPTEPVVDPKVSAPGLVKEADTDSLKPGETVHYTLTSNVPGYLGEFLPIADPKDPIIVTAAEGIERGSYPLTFHDTMNEKLTFNKDVSVTVNGKTLAADLFTVITDTDDGCTFHVTMDLVQIYLAGGYFTLEEIAQAPAIVITYSATLAEDATAGAYPNAAFASFKAQNGKDDQTVESAVNVNVYAIKVYKYDQGNKNEETGIYAPLAGATFTLKDAEGNTVATLDSGEDGYVLFDGLKAGTYTLTEDKAPEGYIKSEKGLEITLPADKMTDNTVTAEFANAKIPHTGGEGTAMFVTMGIVLMGAAAAMFLASQKKRSFQA